MNEINSATPAFPKSPLKWFGEDEPQPMYPDGEMVKYDNDLRAWRQYEAISALATAKASKFLGKLSSDAYIARVRVLCPAETRLIITVFLSVADEEGVGTVRMVIPMTIVDGKAVFDSTLPSLRNAAPPRAPAITATQAERVNEGGIDVIVQSVGEYECFHRPLNRNDFAWVSDDCEIPEDEGHSLRSRPCEAERIQTDPQIRAADSLSLGLKRSDLAGFGA